MNIYSDGKSRVLKGQFPKRFRLKNGDQDVPFIRTGADSVRLSGELPVGELLVEEIIRDKVPQPAKLDAQSIAIINKGDFDRIDILNKKLAINQEKMGEQMNALAEHEATLANLETKNASDIELLNEQTGAAVQLLKGAIEDTAKASAQNDKAIAKALEESTEDLKDSLVAHETAKNPHRITKETVGLDKVENIAPKDMPVSKATQEELDKKADKTAIDEVEKKLTEKQSRVEKQIDSISWMGGATGTELPSGGKKGYVLAKKSNKTGDYEWKAGGGGGVSVHNELTGRSSSDCHPISSITNLTSTLSTETTNRENADNGLQSQIDAITASSDVKDIVGTYAELEAYDTSTLGNNDIIKVLQDETQNDQISYYRWNSTTETFSLIGSEGPYYTKAESDSTFVPQTRTVNGKALSSNITLTYTDVGAINGIDSLMVTTALGYTPVNPSSLATVATSGSYNDLLNKPTIPTSSDYWTVGTSGVNDTQTSYSRKLIKYSAKYTTTGDDQQNGFRVLGDESASTGSSSFSGYWMGRMMVGTNKRTFLLGVTKNTNTNSYMCGLGAHSWTDAEAQTGAAWEDIYIQPDGNKAVYLGGNVWRVNSGWLKVQNDGNGTAAYRTFINTGTNTSPTWRTVLPNQASGSNSVLIKPSTSSTFSYTYGTSINGTVTANYGSSFGYNSSAAGNAVALGENAVASGSYSIQLGHGTNSTANTMNVGLSNSTNVQLLDASGEIPDARIKTTIARVTQIPTDNASLTNGAGYITSASLSTLTDTEITTPTSGEILKYDGSKWINSASGASVTDVQVNGTSVVSGGVASITNVAQTNANNDFSNRQSITLNGDDRVALDMQNNSVNVSSAPATAQTRRITFKDENGDRIAEIQVSKSTAGTQTCSLLAANAISGTTTNAVLGVQVDSSGNSIAIAPTAPSGDSSTAIANTYWVNTLLGSNNYNDSAFTALNTTVASDVSVNGSTDSSYTLSSLPNDGKNYMVLIGMTATTDSTSSHIVTGQLTSALMTGNMNVIRTQTRTASSMQASAACWIPVGSDRKITLKKSTNWYGTVIIYAFGYRRIGTNT